VRIVASLHPLPAISGQHRPRHRHPATTPDLEPYAGRPSSSASDGSYASHRQSGGAQQSPQIHAACAPDGAGHELCDAKSELEPPMFSATVRKFFDEGGRGERDRAVQHEPGRSPSWRRG